MVKITSLSSLLTPTVVVVTLLIWGGAVSSIPKPQPNAPAVNSATTQSLQTEPATASPQESLNTNSSSLRVEPSEACTETSSESTEDSGNTTTNSVSTSVRCEVETKKGSSSVEINSDVNQSATSGSSTGQSGEASNSSSSNIRVNQ